MECADWRGFPHANPKTTEVALRNSVGKALVSQFGLEWWKSETLLGLFDRERTADLQLAEKRIVARKRPLEGDQLVASLSFGFWVGLLQPRYNPPIWGRHLRRCFPHLPITETRGSLFEAARDISFLRNRISHHEPIFKRDLSKDFATTMTLLRWISPATHDWVKPHCRVPQLLRAKP